ncbi:hypothetical protein R1flu_025636 [Riccia fluitans]|uniref:VWFA domain-containing protein n=1 Tax=Riccia fluitans TaxID=41844 RepID=A0ABD1XYC6_9MARC
MPSSLLPPVSVIIILSPANTRCNVHFKDHDCPSKRVSMQNTSVAFPRFPAFLDTRPDAAQARTICGTKNIDPIFQKLFRQNPFHAEYYVGFPDGTHRNFPGRFVPPAHEKFDLFPQAEGLEPESIVVLFNESDPQHHEELHPLKTKVSNLRPATGDSQVTSSNLTAGLQEALRLFDGVSNMAVKNIVLFTSGDIFYDDVGLNTTLKQVSDNLIRLFIFSVNTRGDNLDRVAVTASGYHFRLTTSENPLFRMRAYFSYLAVLRNMSTTTDLPFWTPSYKDFYDIGKIITVVYPAFTRTEPRKLLGVAAIDVLYNEIDDRDIVAEFQVALKNRPESPHVVIGAELFNSIQLPAFDDTLLESCDKTVGERAVCESYTPDKNQNFLDRMCCQKCSGDPDSQRWRTVLAVVGATVGGLGFVSLGLYLLKLFCWEPNRAMTVDPRDTESEFRSGQSTPTGTGPTGGAFNVEARALVNSKPVTPGAARHLSHILASGTVKFTESRPKAKLSDTY